MIIVIGRGQRYTGAVERHVQPTWAAMAPSFTRTIHYLTTASYDTGVCVDLFI